IKRRLCIGQATQIVRHDIELDNYGLAVAKLQIIRDRISRNLQNARPAPDVVLISDYGKGLVNEQLLTEVREFCHRSNIPILADPKRLPPTSYHGYIIKADKLYDRQHQCHKLPNYVCTLEANPPYGNDNGCAFKCHERKTIAPVNTSGAGDCYLAHL